MMSSHSARKGILSATTALLALAGLLVLAGCAGDDGALPRSSVQLVALNQNLPLPSDVYDLGADKEKPDDDFIPIDYVTIKVSNYPADDALTMEPHKAFGSVQFTRYSMKWTRKDLDGDGIDDVEDIEGPMNLLVPINGEAEGAVLAVQGGWKTIPPLSLLVMGGEYRSDATFVFYGTEQTSHIPVQLSGGLLVTFADYADKN